MLSLLEFAYEKQGRGEGRAHPGRAVKFISHQLTLLPSNT
jgi:hypothetical protein